MDFLNNKKFQRKKLNVIDSAELKEFWCLICTLDGLVTSHSIDQGNLSNIELLIHELLEYLNRKQPDLKTKTNAHLLRHVVGQIKLFGPLRDVWCFSFETVNGRLKRYFEHNRNNQSASKAALTRYNDYMVVELIEQVQGKDYGNIRYVLQLIMLKNADAIGKFNHRILYLNIKIMNLI